MSQPRGQPTQIAVDGVPVFWAEGPEPVAGALLFRAGRADETLPTCGVTHVVEHLALFPFGRLPYEYNGSVEENVTVLYATGLRGEVVDFLAGCAQHLSGLPLDRLEDEKRVLGVEAATWGGLYGQLLSYRYGARGYGLMGFRELGLRRLGEQAVADWAGRYFTRGNAVAWLSASPEGMSLPLPDGPRHAAPEPEPIERLRLPAQSWHEDSVVALTFEGQRSSALRAAFGIAGERVHRQLRLEEGVTYSPGGAYHPLTADRVHLMLSSDCAERNAVPVREGLLRILDDLAENGPTEAELEWDRSMLLRHFADPRSVLLQLDVSARRELIGGDPTDDATVLREHEALTPDAVAAAVREVMDTMLLSAPYGTPKSTRSGVAEYDVDDTAPVDGVGVRTRHDWSPAQSRSHLIVGTAALRYEAGSGEALTVRFEDCAAAVEGQCDSLDLVSSSGTTMSLCPDHFEDGARALEAIRKRLPDAIFVPMDEAGLKVDRVTREKLASERSSPLERDLDALARLLSPDEALVNLAEARRTRYRGLLATTDRRLLFVFNGSSETDLRDIPFDDIRILKVKGIRDKRLCVTIEGEYLEFSEFSPRERLGEIRDQLRDAAGL